MTWAAFTLALANLWGWIYAHRVMLAYVAVLIFAAIGVAVVFVQCSPNRDKKADELKQDIIISNVEANVLANQKKEDENAVNKASENVANAVNAYNQSVNRAANSYDGNRANDDYCRRYFCDAGCEQYRRTHAIQESACKGSR